MEKTSKKPGMKKTAAVCIAAVLGAAVCVGSAMAYLTDNEFHVNALVTKEVVTEISEDFPDPEPLEPGLEFTKTVCIENNGEPPCYVRAQVLFSDGDLENQCTLRFGSDDGINRKDWTYLDGWYYYNAVLEPGTITAPLFTSVKIDGETTADALHGFDIYVRQESRQSEGHQDAFEAFGA